MKKSVVIFFLINVFLGQSQTLDLGTTFYGAKGYGQSAGVGQPTRTRVFVTTTADSGPGSLRSLVGSGQSNLDVILKVSGQISLQSQLRISGRNIHIYGQTAFRDGGQGITIEGDFVNNNYGGQMVFSSGDHTVYEFTRLRRGQGRITENSGDALNTTGDNIMIANCSISWATDENWSGATSTNLTIQNSMVYECFYFATHENSRDPEDGNYQGGHSKGSTNGNLDSNTGYATANSAEKWTYYNTLFQNNDARNPQISSHGDYEIVNCRIYYPGTLAIGELGSLASPAKNTNINIVKTHLKAGGDTRTIRPEVKSGYDDTNIYLQGIIGWNRTNDSQPETDAISNGKSSGDQSPVGTVVGTPFNTPMSSEYASLPDAVDLDSEESLSTLGAYLFRDSADSRIIEEAINGPETSYKLFSDFPYYSGSNWVGATGYYTYKNSVAEAGGFPIIGPMNGNNVDADNDGMLDALETQYGVSDPDAINTVWTIEGVNYTNSTRTNFQVMMDIEGGRFGQVLIEEPTDPIDPFNGLLSPSDIQMFIELFYLEG
ncbi:hypothetical protein LCGC14_0943640 [marine sediment metagenome]|uniref:Pectate lyase n=2 Tax=root TaxID=1 RepID=A0A831QMK8_9FLAO|nr:hypothetical protein [Pricia antarctica]